MYFNLSRSRHDFTSSYNNVFYFLFLLFYLLLACLLTKAWSKYLIEVKWKEEKPQLSECTHILMYMLLFSSTSSYYRMYDECWCSITSNGQRKLRNRLVTFLFVNGVFRHFFTCYCIHKKYIYIHFFIIFLSLSFFLLWYSHSPSPLNILTFFSHQK